MSLFDKYSPLKFLLSLVILLIFLQQMQSTFYNLGKAYFHVPMYMVHAAANKMYLIQSHCNKSARFRIRIAPNIFSVYHACKQNFIGREPISLD